MSCLVLSPLGWKQKGSLARTQLRLWTLYSLTQVKFKFTNVPLIHRLSFLFKLGKDNDCKKKSLTSEMIKEIPSLKNLPSDNTFQVTST